MKKAILIFAILSTQTLSAQEMWGIANSNFAGSSGMGLNPACMMLLPSKWEVTLVTADIFLENNYLSYPKYKIVSQEEINTTDRHGGLVESYSTVSKKSYAHLMLKAPAFIIRTRKWAYGIHAAARNELSVRNVPHSLAKLFYEGMNYSSLHGTDISLRRMRAGELVWLEAGLSAGKEMRASEGNKLYGAITLKCVNALAGAYVGVSRGSLNVQNDSTVELGEIRGQVAFAVPESEEGIFRFRGRGVGADIGFCYVANPHRDGGTKRKPSPAKKYDWRFGASLIDLGVVSFGQEARSYRFSNPEVRFDDAGSIKPDGINGVDSLITASIMNGASSGTSFIMSLPTALSVQYDYCLRSRCFLNLSAVQRLPMPFAHIDRPNNISASLRYETTFFEVAVPYSFYDYYLHRIGFAVRYHFLFVGTDKLGTFVSNNNVSGIDLYFGIKLTSFDFMKKVKKTKVTSCAAYS